MTHGPILVTGAAGFVGRSVLAALAGAGREVVGGIHNAAPATVPGGVRLVEADVLDPVGLSAATAGMGTIIHCAVGSARASRVIVEGTRNVATAACAAGVRHLIFLSSVAVYGTPAGVVNEDHPIDRPHGAYGRAKAEAEAICAACASPDLAVTIVRPSLIYGPGSPLWTELFVDRLQTGRWGSLGEWGEGSCNLIHVTDLAAFLVHLTERGSAGLQIYNANGAEIPTWNMYLERLNAALGLPPLGPPRPPPGFARLFLRKTAKVVTAVLRKAGAGNNRMVANLDRFALLTPSADEVKRFADDCRYSIDRMRRTGFEPAVVLSDALRDIAARRRSVGRS